MTTEATIPIRAATEDDLPEIMQLLAPHVERQVLLPREEPEVRGLLKHAFVADADGRVVGFVTLEIYSRKLAEVQCLAVADDFQRQGLGKRLVAACIQRARDENVLELLAITSSEQFLMSCGFHYALPGQKKALFLHTRES
jgi:amino-acid N-acetyltransferase